MSEVMVSALLSLGNLTFLAPMGLLGLVVLPFIWWLLRSTPPSPKAINFPPLAILSGVQSEEQTPDKTPWWLLLFRLTLVGVIAIALARPIMTRMQVVDVKPLLLLMDNDYASAANWSQISKEAEVKIKSARRANVEVALAFTRGEGQIAFVPADTALKRLQSTVPTPLAADYADTVLRLGELDFTQAQALWLTGGVDHKSDEISAIDVLKALGPASKLTVLAPPSEISPLISGAVFETQSGFSANFHRLDDLGERKTDVLAYAADGSLIGRAPLNFPIGSKRAEAVFELPAELRNRVSLIRPEGSSSAGAVHLLDDSWGRPVIGILDNGDKNTQPLLSDTYYVDKALGPYADIFKAPLSELLSLGPSILIMSDNARIEDEALADFVENGGMLIRFAGPKLAARADELLPVELRFGGRELDGALTWGEPQMLDDFDTDSPFYGLSIPKDVTVRRQVMAQPGGMTDQRTWARLTDGSSVVTSAPHGQGRIVLFHVTSGPEWSNLAVSGLYVDMLRRILPLARKAPSKLQAEGGVWSAQRTLDGFGRLTAPSTQSAPIDEGGFENVIINERHLPGLYRQGARIKALNTVRDPKQIGAISDLPNVSRQGYQAQTHMSLSGALLAIALLMLCLDALLSLIITGRLKRVFSLQAIIVMAMIGFGARPSVSEAQSVLETDALGLHLAYVLTGEDRIDRQSEAGLRGVTKELTRRTTVEPLPPRGVNIETDTLTIYPFLYWPVKRDANALNAAQSHAINNYMDAGGTVVFDTMDQGDQISGLSTAHPGLSRISQSLDIPELILIPENHVLTKSFFLLSKFPGRYSDGAVYVDAQGLAKRDGVAKVLVTSNDWAAGWAVNEQGEFIGTLDNSMRRQGEFAKRLGVNLVMYVLAGNYKADQVHYPAILERLGTNGTSMQKTPSVQDIER